MIVGYTAIYRLWGDTKDRHLTPSPDTPKGLYPSALHAWRALFREVAPRAKSDLDAIQMGLDKLQTAMILPVVEDQPPHRGHYRPMTKQH